MLTQGEKLMEKRIFTDAAYFSSQNMWTQLTQEGDNYPHSHTFYEIIYIVNGSIQHNLNGRITMLEAGDLCIIYPGETHLFIRNEKSLSCVHRDIIIKASLFESCCNFLSPELLQQLFDKHLNKTWHLSPEEQHLLDKNLNLLTLNNFASYRKKSEDEKFLCFNLLKHFSSTSSLSSPSNYPQWLTQLLTRFHSPINLKEGLPLILSSCHYHPVYVCRVFKQYTGLTMSNYLLNVRLQHASNLLLITDHTIADVAESLGFQSIPYFNKAFKEMFGIPPSEYRKTHSQI